MRLSERATDVAMQVQGIVRGYVKEYGWKPGLDRFARQIGVSWRRARSFHAGDAGRIDASEYLNALEARGTLARAKVVRLNHELSILQQQGALNAMDQVPLPDAHGAPLLPVVGDVGPLGGSPGPSIKTVTG